MQATDPDLAIVVFDVAGHPYALATEHVREVIAWRRPRPLPGARASVDGVVNVRGGVIPVCDLARSLEVGSLGPITLETAIVICELDGGIVGLMVDQVRSVMTIASDSVMPAETEAPTVEGFVRDETGTIVVLLRPERTLIDGLGGLQALLDEAADAAAHLDDLPEQSPAEADRNAA